MKKNLSKKIISSLLILTFLISAFSVFSFAENTEVTDDYREVGVNADMNVLYNRAFDEGWDVANGFKTDRVYSNRFAIDYEIDVLGNYNYFLRGEVAGDDEGRLYYSFSSNGYVVNDNKVPGTVIEASVKADDLATVGRILYVARTYEGEYFTTELLAIDENGHLILFPGEGNEDIRRDLGLLEDEWVNFAFAFDWTSTVKRRCTVYMSRGLGIPYTEKETFEYTDNTNLLGIEQVSFGMPAKADRPVDDTVGMNVCFDNIRIYQGCNVPVEIEPNNYGLSVNSNEEKVIDIIKSTNDKTAAQLLEESLAMKLGVNYALVRNEKQAIYDGTYGGPVMVNGKIMIPFELLVEYIGFPYYVHPDGISYDITTGITGATYITLGRKTAAVAGKTVELTVAPTLISSEDNENSFVAIALDDIATIFPGWLSLYDDMGLVIIYQDTTPDNADDNAPIATRENDLSAMVNIMKKFVFETVDAASATESYKQTGAKVYNDAKANTNNFAHPYIMANQATFDKLSAAYTAQDTNATLKAYLDAIVAAADAIYNDKAQVAAGAYAGIKADKIPVNVYTDGVLTVPDTDDGYSATTGRIDNIVAYAEILPTLALAYQITGNDNYALLAYDWSAALAKWDHWGPAYFEDTAEVSYSVALAYDWLYNAYVENGLDTEVIAKAIFNNGLHDAYNASYGNVCEHPSARRDMSKYTAEKDSTNAVATSSMIISALAVLDFTSGKDREAELAESIYVIGNNMKMLVENGLEIYAPDGSYVESAIGWARGTSKFVALVNTLMSAAGEDYGFMDVWGIYESCYYAIHIESSDGLIWNYHDTVGDGVTSGDIPVLDTSVFTFLGKYYSDANLIAVRNEQIAKGKAVSIFDVLFYPFDVVAEKEDLPLNYYMEGIQGYVSRSDWNAGALYAGIMGGANNCVDGQVDSGNFIYHNKGIVWFMDLGGEDDSVFEYNVESTKYKYYRASGMGQNTVIMSKTFKGTLPVYGQYATGAGVITKMYENEYGSYAIVDNKSAYGTAVDNALRGMLITNDKKTVVIQDELTFTAISDFYWIAHTAHLIELSDDAKTAYITSQNEAGESYILRATLISDFSLSFQVTDANSALPNSGGITINGASHSASNGGSNEFSRDAVQRLLITGTQMLVATFAVVLEIVDEVDSTQAVGYEWTKMNNWMPLSSDLGNVDSTVRADANVADIRTSTNIAGNLLKKDDVFSARLESLYRELTLVEYTYRNVKQDSLQSADKNAYQDYLDLAEDYEDYLNYVNGVVKNANNVASVLAGMGE